MTGASEFDRRARAWVRHRYGVVADPGSVSFSADVDVCWTVGGVSYDQGAAVNLDTIIREVIAGNWKADIACERADLAAMSTDVARAAADWWVTVLPAGKYSPEETVRFRDALAEVAAAYLRSHPDPHINHAIGCDYDPDAVLCAAAKRAGLDMEASDFPRKTRMLFDKGTIAVKVGYGATWRTVWPASAVSDMEAGDGARVS